MIRLKASYFRVTFLSLENPVSKKLNLRNVLIISWNVIFCPWIKVALCSSDRRRDSLIFTPTNHRNKTTLKVYDTTIR